MTIKKNKIVLLIFIGLIVIAEYSYLKSGNIQHDLANLPSQNTVVSNFPSTELQKKLLAEIKGLEKLPKFEDFPAKEFSSNKKIVVDINSDPVGRLYRTALRSHVENFGIDFAGKYSLAEWGCGSTCQDGAIVDADTGHVYPLPGVMANGHDSRKDSRLLIQNPIIIGGDWTRDWYRMRYWEWAGDNFKLLGVYKVDLAKKEIIETTD